MYFLKNHLMTRLILLFISVLSVTSMFSQRGLEAGALVQPQIFGQLYQDDQPDRAVKIPYSFAIGINVGYNFTDNFGLRSGFIYSPQGEKYSVTSTTPERAYQLNLEYIQVPLFLKLNSSTDRRFSFLLLLGPHISYLNDAELTEDQNDPVSVLGEYSRILTGASASIGVQLNLDQGGNLNVLWKTAGSIDAIQNESNFLSRNISTGFQLAYHYFINF